MTLIKYDTFFNDPFNELDRFFDRAFNGMPRFPDYRKPTDRQFRLDVYGNDEAYTVVAELPGFDKSSIKVDLHNAVLNLSANRIDKEGDQEHTYRFHRSITVGDDVNVDGVSARYENGLLTVTLPKREERKPREISID